MKKKYQIGTIDVHQRILAFTYTQKRSCKEVAEAVYRSESNAYLYLEKLVRDGFMIKEPMPTKIKSFLYKSLVPQLPLEISDPNFKPLDTSSPFEITGAFRWAGNPWREGMRA